jgi:hypothetical protein
VAAGTIWSTAHGTWEIEPGGPVEIPEVLWKSLTRPLP